MNEEIKNIIINNSNLIKKIASRYSSLSSFEDLYQVGIIGLIKAYNKYDKNNGAKFSTYAYKYIQGEMLELLRTDRSIKVSSDYLKLYKAYNKCKEFLTQRDGKEPTLLEISKFMNVSEKSIEDAFIACEFVSSLDKDINNDEGLNLYEIVGDAKEENYEEKIMVKEAIENLEEIERKLVACRFYKDLTQSETAEYMNMSQIQVSRLEKKVKEKIRVRIG